MIVLLATLGQRPEAITMALDAMFPRYHYAEVLILHTDRNRSDIADAYANLMAVLTADYGGLKITSKTLCYADGRALIDITDQHSAEAYYHALLETVWQYRVRYIPLHLLVAGGRKAMSIYAALAASVLFGEHDRVWTVHTPPELMLPGRFHAPAGLRDRIQVIQLPVIPSRLLPGVIAGREVGKLIQRARISPRQHFMQSLTDEEHRLAEMLHQHPYAENNELGRMLAKSPKTVENQLRSIYQKLAVSFDLTLNSKHKRQALLDVLADRI